MGSGLSLVLQSCLLLRLRKIGKIDDDRDYKKEDTSPRVSGQIKDDLSDAASVADAQVLWRSPLCQKFCFWNCCRTILRGSRC